MLNAQDLKEYRTLRGLTQRDVAMYCDVSYRLIGEIETGKRNLTENNYKEIVKGINGAIQAIARGTFEEDKKKYTESMKKGTKPTTSKEVDAKKQKEVEVFGLNIITAIVGTCKYRNTIA